MMVYDWPGNVRELENAIERAVVVGKGRTILPGNLPMTDPEATPRPAPTALREVEKEHIRQTLELNGWNISRSAERLCIDRSTLYNKIKRYGIQRQV